MALVDVFFTHLTYKYRFCGLSCLSCVCDRRIGQKGELGIRVFRLRLIQFHYCSSNPAFTLSAVSKALYVRMGF